MRAQVVRRRRAVELDRRGLAITELGGTVDARQRQREYERERSGKQRRPEQALHGHASEPAAEAEHHARVDREEDRVVHRAVQLPHRQKARRHRVPAARRRRERVQRDERERHAVRHLQLEVAVVLEPVGIEPEQQRRDEGARARSGQPLDEHVHRDPGCDEAQDHHDVVPDDGMEAREDEGRGRDRREEHRVRVRQRQRMRIEDVGAEERARIAVQFVQDPAVAPDRKERISEIGDGVHVAQLRIEQHRGERGEAQHGDPPAPPPGWLG